LVTYRPRRNSGEKGSSPMGSIVPNLRGGGKVLQRELSSGVWKRRKKDKRPTKGRGRKLCLGGGQLVTKCLEREGKCERVAKVWKKRELPRKRQHSSTEFKNGRGERALVRGKTSGG